MKKPLHPQYGFETLAIHAGTPPEATTGARSFPIYQTTSYVFEDADHAASLFNLQTPGFIYSRLTNPTVAALEERLATLEGGRGATCTASGHSSEVLALYAQLSPGREVLVANKLYGGSINLMGKSFQKFDWKAIFVEATDPDAFRQAVTGNTRAIFVESLANPGGVVIDLEAIDMGAELASHSTTKFLSGQGNAVGGVVIDAGTFPWLGNEKFPSLSQPAAEYNGITFAETFGNDLAYTLYSHAVSLRDLGATMSPFHAWLTLNGVETLALRMERHCQNAQRVAEYLQGHPQVEWVSNAG